MGNIPLEWYDDYPHLGYDLDGKKIMKPLQGDQVKLKRYNPVNYLCFSLMNSLGRWMTLTTGIK